MRTLQRWCKSCKLQLLAFEPHAIANPPGDDGPHSASFVPCLEVRYNALVTTVHYTLDSLPEAWATRS